MKKVALVMMMVLPASCWCLDGVDQADGGKQVGSSIAGGDEVGQIINNADQKKLLKAPHIDLQAMRQFIKKWLPKISNFIVAHGYPAIGLFCSIVGIYVNYQQLIASKAGLWSQKGYDVLDLIGRPKILKQA